MSCTTSGCVTTPSSLLRTHAPDPRPLDVCGFPSTSSLCRLPSAPAGLWPFPTLSPRSLYRRLDPYPVVSFRCTCSFLPGRLRPHVRIKTFGTQETPCHAASTGETISGLQSFVYLQAPMLARPPSCTYRCIFSQGSQAVYTTHGPVRCRYRDVASLRVRHEQLTRLDFHQLDRGLVGRSVGIEMWRMSTLGDGLSVSAFPLYVPT